MSSLRGKRGIGTTARMKKTILALALGAATVTGTLAPAAVALAAGPAAEQWSIGPVIRGRNHSVGMPPSLRPGRDGATFDFPVRGQGSVHYVSLDTAPLQGARRITLRYRVDAAPGARFVAEETGQQGKLGLAFHRAGDNWTAKGRYEAYRWYSPGIVPLTPGVHTFSARLDDPRWIGVMRSTGANNPEAFAAALANTETVSLTFGAEDGRGHGVYATAPARFTILDFRID